MTLIKSVGKQLPTFGTQIRTVEFFLCTLYMSFIATLIMGQTVFCNGLHYIRELEMRSSAKQFFLLPRML